MDPFGILYTDLYQLTMGQVYFRMGLHEKEALFEAFYRRNPDYGAHQAGYTVFAGLDPLLSWMEEARFGEEEIAALHPDEMTPLEALRALYALKARLSS